MENAMKFNAKKFIQDCGGVKEVSKLLGKTRTAPYRMISTGYMTTWHFEKIKIKKPNIKIDDYFESELKDGNKKRRI
jgi:predicted DNA-binding transcriptional regulator AlpA|tara:strand:- start:556 stop:786 length:231 start_codon:yes stop_codon:yes gene_type:complete